jgi:hypothetical protein
MEIISILLILYLKIDHQDMLNSNQYFSDLDRLATDKTDKALLKKVEEIKIEKSVIDRRRLSIGINDIAVKNNTYSKQGTYVSKFYPVDFNIYTFSLKVDEYIPKYLNLESYDVIKYYVEFNSEKLERISPINRKNEYENELLVPKMIIFDKVYEETDYVKYLEYTNIIGFKIKIIFDLSSLQESQFPPPEVRDYRCIVYNKEKFFNV